MRPLGAATSALAVGTLAEMAATSCSTVFAQGNGLPKLTHPEKNGASKGSKETEKPMVP